jgi:hypothetical protein
LVEARISVIEAKLIPIGSETCRFVSLVLLSSESSDFRGEIK